MASQGSTQNVTVTESFGGGAKVDREAGIVRGVKLIGFQSKNRRFYKPSSLKSAVHHYEGAKVNFDHPDKGNATGERKYSDRFGVIRNARFVEAQGVFGDFHFNPKHSLAEQFCWDAENNPESLGFSHNATMRLGKPQDGNQVIEEVVGVRSMDLVADPATTTSLFESEEPMDPAATPEAPASTPGDQIKAAFKQMIMAAIDDTSLDMKATLAKIKEIMKSQEKLIGGGGSEPSDDAPPEEPGEESVQLKQQNALLKQQLEQYVSKEKQTKLVESIDQELAAAGLDPKNPAHVSELFSKHLLATESVDDRTALIKDRAALVGAKGRPSTQPVYQPGTFTATESIDPKSFASRLLS